MLVVLRQTYRGFSVRTEGSGSNTEAYRGQCRFSQPQRFNQSPTYLRSSPRNVLVGVAVHLWISQPAFGTCNENLQFIRITPYYGSVASQ